MTRTSFMRLTFALTLLLGLVGCATSSTTQETEAEQVTTLDGTPVLKKTVPMATYFYGEYELPAEEIQAETKPLAEKVAIAAVKKAKVDIVGPLTLFLPDWREESGGDVTIGVGYPVKGSGQLVPQFDQDRKGELTCLSVVREAGEDNTSAWEQLHTIADEQGLQVSGQNRAVVTREDGRYQTELQLGVR